MIGIVPDGTGLPGIEQLRVIVGAVMTIGLILSVLADDSDEGLVAPCLPCAI